MPLTFDEPQHSQSWIYSARLSSHILSFDILPWTINSISHTRSTSTMIDELLVHISTPATRQNDELYRSLADAYLGFEPQRTHPCISRPQQHGAPPPTASGVNGSAGSLCGSFIGGTAGPSFLSTSKDSYGSFPSHLSSDGHAKSHTEPGDSDPEEDHSIPTSSRLARLERIHQNWRQQTTPKSSFIGGKRPAKQISSSPVDADTTFIEDTQLGAQALQSQLQDSYSYSYSATDDDTSEDEGDGGDGAGEEVVPSVKPVEREAPSTGRVSMLPPPIATPASSKAIPAILKAHPVSAKANQVLTKADSKPSSVTKDRSTVEVLPPASSKVTPAPSSTVNQQRESLRSVTANSTVVKSTPARLTAAPKSSGVVAKPREGLHPSESPGAVGIPASARSTAVSKSSGVIAKSRESLHPNIASTLSVSNVQQKTNSSKSIETLDTPVQPIDFSKLPIDAFPPEPKISVEQPSTLPSQVTKHLALLKKQQPLRFKPTKSRYTPNPDDRGYWVIDCSLWTSNQQQKFWHNMSEQIEAGRLGWGATLHREAGSSRALGKVRVYCWGEVVEHMWLVLWLCSRAKVVGSGLKWYDADGVAVFEMP
jgi:hypothetical protein